MGWTSMESALYDCLGHIEIWESILPPPASGDIQHLQGGSGKPAWALGGVGIPPSPSSSPVTAAGHVPDLSPRSRS